ncbi:50S ribosomal protein L23 [Candidatus Providencia siddallii]|uniref:Large ribosomal subunit protein uL23 n=1 Tax=Candidatus Providencia siddallii TaxID=1715285 RepID=A0ABM9NNT7_9GAMM
MINKERLFKILKTPHLSEKTSSLIKKNNTIVIKVIKDATKNEIKKSIQKLFEIKVKSINTLLIKGKSKRHGKHIGYRNDWKKAYIRIKEGYNLDFFNNSE